MKFKDYYDLAYAAMLAAKIGAVYQPFNQTGFVAFVAEQKLDAKEFSQRQDLFADALEEYLPHEYTHALKILTVVLGPELQRPEGMFTEGWWLWPVGRFVERHVAQDFDLSVKFIGELTKRFTGEFAMRPLLTQDPARALAVTQSWSKDPNVHVRRLASECLRIRLPWAKKLTVALDYFVDYRLVLENLKHDETRFVQKSVGNNLNDLFKEDAAKAQSAIADWQANNPSQATLWIIKHALRNQK